MKIEVTEQERQLLDKILSIAVKNGNSVNPEAFHPNPEEYKTTCQLWNKVEQKETYPKIFKLEDVLETIIIKEEN